MGMFMRIVRFFASSGVAYLISAIVYIVSMLPVESFRVEGVHQFIAFMLSYYLFPFCYAGCLIGEFVYTFASKINNRIILTIIFALTGAIYSYLIHKFVFLHGNPIDMFFYAAVLGSISFYWAHFIPSRKLSIQLSIIPGYVLILFIIFIAF
jgi:hypothetical protein